MNIFKFFRKNDIKKKQFCGTHEAFDPFSGLTDTEKMIAVSQNGGAGWIYRNDPYMKVMIVHKCQKMNATKFSEVISYAYLRSKVGEKKPIENDPIFKVIFGMPNDIERDPHSLFQFMLLQYYQSGIAYAHAIGKGDRSVMSIEPLFSYDVSALQGTNVFEPRITGYTVTGKDTVKPEEMLVVRDINPYSRIDPVSPYGALYGEMEILELINKWQHRNYTRGVKPDIIVNLDPDFGIPDDKQWDEIYKMMSRRFEGPEGQGIFVMAGGGKAVAVQTSPADLQMIDSEKFSAASVASFYGVPQELLSVEQKNYATAYVPAKMSWVENTIVPIAQHFIRALNSFFYAKSDRELVLDTGQIPELRPTLKELEESNILTVNEKRAMRGLPVLDDEMAGRLLVPVSLQPLEALEKEEKPEEENI